MEIELTKGYKAIVDDEDFERLSAHKWCAQETANGTTYAVRAVGPAKDRKKVPMARDVLDLPELPAGLEVDHVNRNPLDNRKSNLRLATRSQNQANIPGKGGASKYKGVYKAPYAPGKWFARITVNGKKIHLGTFENEWPAARAYDRAALRYFGEFAYLNLPAFQRRIDEARGKVSGPNVAAA